MPRPKRNMLNVLGRCAGLILVLRDAIVFRSRRPPVGNLAWRHSGKVQGSVGLACEKYVKDEARNSMIVSDIQ